MVEPQSSISEPYLRAVIESPTCRSTCFIKSGLPYATVLTDNKFLNSKCKGGEKIQRKYKILALILVAAMVSTAVVWATAPYYSSYTRNFTWTQAAANTQFELDVNGTQQTSSTVPVPYQFTYATDQYCEVYTLINQGNVPIVITAAVTGTGAVGTWMSNNVAYLGVGQTTAMVLYFTDFASGGGTNAVTFNSAQAYPGSSRVTSYTINEINDADSGQYGNGYWALDSFAQNVQIYSLSGGGYAAFVDYVGTWTTYTGVYSPAANVQEGAGGSGPMLFSYAATFPSLPGGDSFPTTGTTINENVGGYQTGGVVYANVSPYHWYSDPIYFPTALSYTEVSTGGAGEQALYAYSSASTSLNPVLQHTSPYPQIWTGFGTGHGNILIP